jgi:membrane protease YdiL (CAAX protease family)
VEPIPEPPPAPHPIGRKSALAFFGVLLALWLPGAAAQSAVLSLGLAWTELFVFLLASLVATAGSNLRLRPYLRLGPARPAAVAVGALAGGAGYLFAGSILSLTERCVPLRWVEAFDPVRLFSGSPGERLLLALVATALAPVCEEIAFRGYVQTTLRLAHRPAPAIVAAATLFALLHVNPVLFPALVVLGTLFGWLAWRAGSIWPAVAAHAVNNGITSAIVLAGGPQAATAPPPLEAVASAIAFGGGALLLVVVAYRATTPGAPPAPETAVILRDPAEPSIRFSMRRVPPALLSAVLTGGVLLAALLAVRAMSGPARTP